MLRKITIVQCEVGRELTRDENLLIFKQRPDYVVLPEYYNVDPMHHDAGRNSAASYKYLEYCRTLSDRFGCTLIAGTAIESEKRRFFNTAYVFKDGREFGSYRKQNPTANEQKHGITAGDGRNKVAGELIDGPFTIDGMKFSIMVCADVLLPVYFERLAPHQPDLIFVPTTSPYRPGEHTRDKFARDSEIFVKGARKTGAIVVKCCAVGQLWGGRLQGRSLVAAPWGVLTRIEPSDENRERILSVVLDIAELREFRLKILAIK